MFIKKTILHLYRRLRQFIKKRGEIRLCEPLTTFIFFEKVLTPTRLFFGKYKNEKNEKRKKNHKEL